MREIGERLRQPAFLWNLRFREAGEALLVGDHTRAEELAADAYQIGMDSGQPDTLTTFGGQITVVNHQRGTLTDLIPMIESAFAENPGIPLLSALLGLAHLERGARDEAQGILGAFVSTSGVALPQDLLWMAGIVSLSELAIGLWARMEAAILLELVLPYSGQIPYAGAFPMDPVDYYIAGLMWVLGQDEEALSYSGTAATLANSGDMKFSSARIDLQWGRILLRHNDVEGGSRMIRHALQVAVDNGYAAVEAQANLALESLG